MKGCSLEYQDRRPHVRNTASAWAFARMQARQAVRAIIGGYRELGYNYRQNGTILDLISHGPYGGIEITF